MLVRPLQPGADVVEVQSFLARLEAATGIPPLGESKFVDLGGPRRGIGFIGDDGGIVAYLHMLRHAGSDRWEVELATEAGSVGPQELEALLETAATIPTGGMLWWTFGDTGPAGFAAERFPETRRLHKLSGALPISEPVRRRADVEMRPFRPGLDETRWLATNNAAFAGHPENGGWTEWDIRERQSRDWFDPEGFRLWWAGDRMAGFCWTKRHSPTLGEVHVIGVHPDFQGRGLGRLIVIEALWYLAGAGCTSAMLYVDVANQSALALYQSLGFELERIDRCFEIPKAWPHEVQ